mgnify:CR=1 FL=1
MTRKDVINLINLSGARALTQEERNAVLLLLNKINKCVLPYQDQSSDSLEEVDPFYAPEEE